MKTSQLSGRHRIVQELVAGSKCFSLDIGCGNKVFGDVNIDVTRCFLGWKTKPSLLASALYLPFQSDIFERVFMLDVIEHLPAGTESKALLEIERVNMKSGKLILSVPNDRLLYKSLDPAYHFRNHRHYSIASITNIINQNGLRIENIFTSGGLGMVANILVNGPIKVILGSRYDKFERSMINRFLKRFDDIEQQKSHHTIGYTIFVVAKKPA